MRWILNAVRQSGYLALLSSNFGCQILGFAASLLVARYVPPEDLATYRLLQVFSGLSIAASTCGWGAALLGNPAGGPDLEARVVRAAILSSFLPPLAIGAIVCSGLSPFSTSVSTWLPLFSLGNMAWSFAQMLLLHEQSQRRIHRMAGIQILQKLFATIVPAIATWSWGLPGFVYGNLVAGVLIIAPLSRISSFDLSCFRPFRIELPSSPDLKLAGSAFIANMVYIIGQSSDMLLIDRLDIPGSTKGSYALASIITTGAQQFLGTAQSILAPYLVSINTDHRILFKRTLRFQLMALPVVALLCATGYIACRFVLPLLYGDAYLQAVPIAGMLLIKLFLLSSMGFLSLAQFATGKLLYNTYVALLFLATAFLTGLPLGTSSGGLGISVSQVIAAAAAVAFAWLLFLRQLNAARREA